MNMAAGPKKRSVKISTRSIDWKRSKWNSFLAMQYGDKKMIYRDLEFMIFLLMKTLYSFANNVSGSFVIWITNKKYQLSCAIDQLNSYSVSICGNACWKDRKRIKIYDDVDALFLAAMFQVHRNQNSSWFSKRHNMRDFTVEKSKPWTANKR